MAAHPDVDRIAFTGSTETGRRIIEASTTNIKKLQLELGGKSADIICADADLDKAVPGAAMGVFANSGQICFAGTRVLVQRSIVDEFTRRLLAFMETQRVGHSLDGAATMGPVISQQQLDTVLSYIDIGKNEGAELLHGGQRLGDELGNGYFVQPTVFGGVTNQMRIAREEIFGPVLSILPFDDIDEAIAIANDSEFGLGGAVWSEKPFHRSTGGPRRAHRHDVGELLRLHRPAGRIQRNQDERLRIQGHRRTHDNYLTPRASNATVSTRGKLRVQVHASGLGSCTQAGLAMPAAPNSIAGSRHRQSHLYAATTQLRTIMVTNTGARRISRPSLKRP